jgi:hypothetical protein
VPCGRVPTCRDLPPCGPVRHPGAGRAEVRRNSPIRAETLRFAPIRSDSRRFGRNHFSARPGAIGLYRFCRLGRRLSDLRVFDCQVALPSAFSRQCSAFVNLPVFRFHGLPVSRSSPLTATYHVCARKRVVFTTEAQRAQRDKAKSEKKMGRREDFLIFPAQLPGRVRACARLPTPASKPQVGVRLGGRETSTFSQIVSAGIHADERGWC